MTDIADILQREGVIDNNRGRSSAAFCAEAPLSSKPGEYSFQKNASLRDVIGHRTKARWSSTPSRYRKALTSEQIVTRLSENDIFAGVREMPREGTLLPETYKFARAALRRDQVLQRMQQTQKRVAGRKYGETPQSGHSSQTRGAAG